MRPEPVVPRVPKARLVPKTHTTAYDAWLVLLVLAALVVPWVLLAWQAQSQAVPTSVWWSMIGINLFVLGLLRATAWPVSYTIDGEMLIVRSGLVKIRIVLGSIVRVEPTRSPLSSPAWSLDRLRIVFRTGQTTEGAVLISPHDKRSFLAELETACGRTLGAD